MFWYPIRFHFGFDLGLCTHIKSMPTLCPQFLALHSKLTKQNSVFCQLKFPVSLALAKHKQDYWKRPKSKTWRMIDLQNRVASSWYPLGRNNENEQSWLGAFWSKSGFWFFKVVFQNTTLVLLRQLRRRLHIQTNQYLYISPRNAKN
jgi:hypothetical protein